jgi:hypothetical protein
MAFDGAMKAMGQKPKTPSVKKPSKAPDESKGKQKPTPTGKTEGEHGDGPGDAQSPIHEHLSKMHEMTGNAHSHIEHHFDGHHTSHHISEHGEMSGPHEHPNTEALKGHMDQMLGGDQMGQQDSGNAMVGNEPQHSMSGF